MNYFYKTKFLQIISLCVLTCHFTNVAAMQVDQVKAFKDFADKSWKTDRIQLNNSGGGSGSGGGGGGGASSSSGGGGTETKTIEERLVDEFKSKEWGPLAGSPTKINNNINNGVLSYYNGNPNPPNPDKWDAWRSSQSNALTLNDSPRQWMNKLDLREIYRFKEFVTSMPDFINNDSHEDDLVKARSLCGIFYEVDITRAKRAEKSFSGMLIPNQPFTTATNGTYKVHTCMHGFDSGNKDNNIAYYFVPYGVMVTGIPGKNNYVPNKGFKVTHIHQGGVTGDKSIDEASFREGSMTTPMIYSQNDYAEAKINGKTGETGTGTSLKEVLLGTGFGIVTNNDPNLPNINNAAGTPAVNDTDANFADEERLFVIGLAVEHESALDEFGLAISTTLKNEGPATNPRRSIADNENTKNITETIAERNHEYSSSLASYRGMSGGPVLRCRLNRNDLKNKKCAFIGTVFGAERVFNTEGQLVGFRNFINKKP